MPDFFFDMETNDPDDVFTLALLATHPRSNLVGVTLHPGGHDQVGIVRHVLDLLGKSGVPIGAGDPKSDKPKVSEFHYRWLGKVPPRDPDGTAIEVIWEVLQHHPEAHLVTGAALTNIAAAAQLKKPFSAFFKEWTCQGGFAGDNIVPAPLRLPKFNGRVTCPTFNLGGDSRAAEYLLCSNFPPIDYRKLVPKNVCHGVFWSPEVNERIPSGAHPGLDLIKEGMSCYFQRRPDGKALHDVIAAVAALSHDIGTWVPVEPYRTPNGEWGCREFNELVHTMTMDASNPPLIMIALDNPAFEIALSA